MNFLKQKINKPKELWKTLKRLDLPYKAASASSIFLKDKNEIKAPFPKVFFNLAQNVVSKLPPSLNVLLNLKLHPAMIILSLRT